MNDPQHYARWVRRVHSMEHDVPICVDLLAEKCRIPIYEDSIRGFLGLWFHVRECEGIVLAEGQAPRRRRFTLAHELGHACLPAHRKSAGLKCLEEDLSEADSNRTMETEANAFAAELLAPRKLVTPMLASGAISIRKADEIAEWFDVSLTCVVRRVVEYGKQPAAMVLCDGGKVKWSVRRNGFPYGLPGSGDAIPPGSIARGRCRSRRESRSKEGRAFDLAAGILWTVHAHGERDSPRLPRTDSVPALDSRSGRRRVRGTALTHGYLPRGTLPLGLTTGRFT